MSRIKSTTIENLKAVRGRKTLDLNGCSIIVYGGNNKGKTTLLRGMVDRIIGEEPDVVVTTGEEKGMGDLVLDTGEVFKWAFDDKGTDKLTLVTKENYKVPVTKAIAQQFFKAPFDIDEFLNSQPKEKVKTLQKLVGLDFTMIDLKYQTAYAARTEKNRVRDTELSRLREYATEPEKVEPVVIGEIVKAKEEVRAELDSQYQKNQAENKNLREKYAADVETAKVQYDMAGVRRDRQLFDHKKAIELIAELVQLGYHGSEALKWANSMTIDPEPVKDIIPEPAYITPEYPVDTRIADLDKQLNDAAETNQKAQKYANYQIIKKNHEKYVADAEESDAAVKAIEEEKKKMIATAKLPEGITITDDEILVDGFPLNKNQLSTSKLYCSALKLASLNLGEVRMLHFDASSLDNNSLDEIQKWADGNNLQLLIERAAWDGGEITYELIENKD